LAAFPFRFAETVARNAKTVFLPVVRAEKKVTAAGPFPIFTGFPIKLNAPEQLCIGTLPA